MSSKYFEDPDDFRTDSSQNSFEQGGVPSSANKKIDQRLVAKFAALDPAAKAETDMTSLRAKVEAVLEGKDELVHQSSAGGSTGDFAEAGEFAEEVGELVPITALRTKRTAKKWAVVAAVAAGAVVLSSGGYMAGVAQKSTGSDAVLNSVGASQYADRPAMQSDSAQAPLTQFFGSATLEKGQIPANAGPGGGVTDYADAGGLTPAAGKDTGASADMAVKPTAQGVAGVLAMKWQSGQFEFTDGGLSTTGGTAQGWGRDASGIYSKATAEKLAKDLGVKGNAKDTESAYWYVGASSGNADTGFIQLDRTGQFSYNNFVDSKKKAPSDASAIKQTKAFLKSIGLNGDDWVFEPQRYEGSPAYLWVQAYPTQDGVRLGDNWGFDFNANGITSAYGSIAPTISLGAYDVVSPSEALARLNDTRFASKIWPNSYPADVQTAWETGDGGIAYTTRDADGITTTVTAQPGAKLDWNVAEVTIDQATLGLDMYTNNDGSQLFLPTYELKAKGGGSWSVVAVSDASLNM